MFVCVVLPSNIGYLLKVYVFPVKYIVMILDFNNILTFVINSSML